MASLPQLSSEGITMCLLQIRSLMQFINLLVHSAFNREELSLSFLQSLSLPSCTKVIPS